ncbi:flippase [Agarivorans sp. 1_MG-2023]|uniref:flippase n=1 Tax=Agarivorans sp. 1_MG-2023 TaxID=3062634 RepID=UPI0026E2B1E2|nr:flippase [Agarivorans sp. 1_MG-2023]MDO6764815.1 flippase [Agarivorans sp. 1_MG-2023]
MRITHIVWNLLGLTFPLIVAALTVPHLITIIGTERFGFLTLAWAAIGYASILDLGVGRAVTQQVASYLGANQKQHISSLVSTAIALTSSIGLLAFLSIFLLVSLGATEFIPRTEVQASELRWGIILLGIAIPLQAVSATYKGVNEAYLNFKGISILRVFLGSANFGLPYLLSFYCPSLQWLILSLVASRLIALVVYRQLALRQIIQSTNRSVGLSFDFSYMKQLFKFSAWVTLSSIIGPFLVQADRFFISAMISAAAVTAYVIPFEISVQSLVLVGAISSVAFPTISGLLSSNREQAEKVFLRWLFIVAGFMAIAMGGLSFAMPYILNFWVGEHISNESIRVGQLLCLGVYINSIGSMVYSWLHANAKTKSTALIHCFELPIFFALLYVFISLWGIWGAALAWVCRVFIDTCLLSLVALHYQRLKCSNSGHSYNAC